MAEDRQPADVVEGATSGDVEDEVQPTAKSAEDRKAAAALSKLDARGDDEGAGREVDQEAIKNAMSSLGGGGDKKKETKTVKVDAADVKLLVDELELPKIKATELLKSHDGDAVKALRAYLQPAF
ncbi:uncharacterized protein C8A04DRAFT_24401 [Dichotomopilus funicola]|uniref:Nascent polypeptide-associated complex subunit alpha-like UBA domain-containing protein n=1 Tax=Dichotomopilus funicola TaxID=1934379 RepID=A0AAN6ZQB3_9PEZI|nr:hypothetical protein C8A04DRAFT_24401 [Dichotomopilus funicola]